MSSVGQDQQVVIVRWSDDGQRTWHQKTVMADTLRDVFRALVKPGRSLWVIYPKDAVI